MVLSSPMPSPALFCSSSSCSRPTASALSAPTSPISSHKASKFGVSVLFSPWSGLKHLGLSLTPKSLQMERKRRSKGMSVSASLFGVGAPEALVIGVVALLVFGPKGLAEVARNLGKTLRAFQPTIRELQEVSREFKSTLEKEIGLDELSEQNTSTSSKKNAASPSTLDRKEDPQAVVDPIADGASSPTKAYSSEEYLKITEEQLKASALQQQEQMPSSDESTPQSKIEQTAATAPPSSNTENGT